jgi:hypothetical protein
MPKYLKSGWTRLDMDVTHLLTKSGEKSVIFKYTKGLCRLDIKDLELLVDGKVVATDSHHGFTGLQANKNIFKVALDKYSEGSKYQIRFLAKGDGGTDSYGEISISE